MRKLAIVLLSTSFAACSTQTAGGALVGGGLGLCSSGVAVTISNEVDAAGRADPSETYLGVSCGIGITMMAVGGIILLADEQQQKLEAKASTSANRKKKRKESNEEGGYIYYPRDVDLDCKAQCRADSTTVEDLQICLEACAKSE